MACDLKRLFSYRLGIKQDKKIQKKSMDTELRIRIWNQLHEFYFQHNTVEIIKNPYTIHTDNIIDKIYDGFFKEDSSICHHTYEVKEKFLDLKWDEVYSFIEFMISNFPLYNSDSLRNNLNHVLREESSNYSIIGNLVTPLTSKIEKEEIERAQYVKTNKVDNHINDAIKHLSDKKNPDPRNSIKESISAVEALCKKIIGDNNATLGQALLRIEKKAVIDPHLIEVLQKLYKFTNDTSGVRHSHAEGKTIVDFEEAKFMLIICSATVNYLVMKYNVSLEE